MSSKTVEIRFGSEAAGFLLISVRGRAYRHRKEYWDGNWLLVDVEVQLPKFTAHVPGVLRAEELRLLSHELREFYEAVKDTVSFATLKSWLEFQISADQQGHVTLAGKVTDAHEHQNYLKFVVEAEQTVFAGQLGALQQAIDAYPVIGLSAQPPN